MHIDLRMDKGVSLDALDEHDRAAAAVWWNTVRVRELVSLGVIDPDTGLVRVRA